MGSQFFCRETLRSQGPLGACRGLRVGPSKLSLSENRSGNIANGRLLVNPHGPNIRTEFRVFFLEENDLNSEE